MAGFKGMVPAAQRSDPPRRLMRYEGRMYRPPSEARSYILQATIGCSHNLCTYCDMYRDKEFRERELSEVLEDIREAARAVPLTRKVFVADGDALVMGTRRWLSILDAVAASFPRLRRVSAYATARNILEKSDEDLRALRTGGLSLLYIGPESGDDVTLKRIVKGNTFRDHVVAAERARAAGMKLSVIVLLGAGGVERTEEHARGTAELITKMDPDYLSALTLTVIPGTPIHRMMETGRFRLPDVEGLLAELRTMVAESEPTRAVFRTNHASNYLALEGRLPRDRDRIVSSIDAALRGEVPLRPEYFRGL
jgi:radical SAM superfamily enzyme YgiQ (UPF0313 family)